MVQLKTNQHAYVAGRTQSGKSTLIKSLLVFYPRLLYHDRKHEHADFAMRNHYALLYTPDQVFTALQKGAKRIMYQPADGSVEDFDQICEIVFNTGNLCLVIDESASYCAHGQMPYYCGELLRLGAGRGIAVLSLTQRTRVVANDLLSESTLIVAFRLNLQTDRQKIIQTIGTHINTLTLGDWRQMINASSRTEEKLDMPVTVDEVLRTLPPFHFLMFDSNSETIHICAPVQMK